HGRPAAGAVAPAGLERALAVGAREDGLGIRRGGGLRFRRGLLLRFRSDPLLELLHGSPERFCKVRELASSKQHEDDQQDDEKLPPRIEIRNCRAPLRQKMPPPAASTSPIRPMKKKCPAPAKLRVVVEPKRASAPNIPAVTTNVVAIEAPVYMSNTSDNVTPFS